MDIDSDVNRTNNSISYDKIFGNLDIDTKDTNICINYIDT